MALTATRIYAECARVVVVKDGRAVFDMPWEAALSLSKALHSKAKLAEEWANKDRLIQDQGILHQMGVRLGLISSPVLRKEALKAAQRDDLIRRNIPNNIREDADTVGVPRVVKHFVKGPENVRPAA